MTDHEHSNVIKQAVGAVRSAIHKATLAGLDTQLECRFPCALRDPKVSRNFSAKE